MSISPRSTCWWSSALAIVGVLTLAAAQPPQKTEKVPPFLEEFQTGKPHDLSLFLDDFSARTDPRIVMEDVWSFRGNALGQFGDFLARPEGKKPLPAIILAFNEKTLSTWMETNARHLASIGYAVYVVRLDFKLRIDDLNFDKEPQQRLAYCMQWLRERPDVLPNRLGVVGFGACGRQALLFASSRAVQACVVCGTTLLPAAPHLLRGLRGTPVLVVYGAEDPPSPEGPVFAKVLSAEGIVCKLHAAPKSRAEFLGPPERKEYNHDAAEDAWVAIYNFLEKHVEDAKPAEAVARPAKSALTISDMMRAVNDPTGVRGTLSKALGTEPKTARQWGHVRAHAALIAELGAWLQTQAPPKGPAGHWQEQAQAFTAAAAAIVDAAERRDHALAQRRLADLAGKCAACHNEHR